MSDILVFSLISFALGTLVSKEIRHAFMFIGKIVFGVKEVSKFD
jgi:hypothetical protein